jgi:hypothetical protein
MLIQYGSNDWCEKCSRRKRWERHVVHVREMINEYKSLVGRAFLGDLFIDWRLMLEFLEKQGVKIGGDWILLA